MFYQLYHMICLWQSAANILLVVFELRFCGTPCIGCPTQVVHIEHGFVLGQNKLILGLGQTRISDYFIISESFFLFY